MRLSVVIPFFRAEETLPACLAALAAQSRAPDEVIVIDDGAPCPPPVDAAGAALPGMRVVRHPRNLGLAAARNTGLSTAAGEIVVYLDADVAAAPTLIARLEAEFLRDPALAGVGARVAENGGDTISDRWRRAFWTQSGVIHGRTWMLPGLCAAYRRAGLLAVGGFRERFARHGEDVDVGVRLCARGSRLLTIDQPLASHLRRDTAASLLAMVCRHSYWQARAAATPTRVRLLIGLLRWMGVSTGSSLRRHRSWRMAALSPLLCGAAVVAAGLGALDGV